MKRSVSELKRDARQQAEAKGHDILHFARTSCCLHVGFCRTCKSIIQINSHDDSISEMADCPNPTQKI